MRTPLITNRVHSWWNWQTRNLEVVVATLSEHIKYVKLLVDSNAFVNSIDKHEKITLDIAISSKNSDIAELLRKHGAKTGAELKVEEK